MAIYLNTETGEYPRHDGDLELLDWKIGDPLPSGWVEVEQDPIPAIKSGQTYESNPPQEIDGVWRVTWSIREITAKELATQKLEQEKLEQELKIR